VFAPFAPTPPPLPLRLPTHLLLLLLLLPHRKSMASHPSARSDRAAHSM
jgi:hypothetical protein